MRAFTNARIVRPDEVVRGCLVLEGGHIAAVDEGDARGEDCEGDYLIPGLVELHTDHLETHVKPRPGVQWNSIAAIQAHDAQIAASGITTVFDALRVGMEGEVGLTSAAARAVADDILAAQNAGRLRAEHRFHLRCEVSGPDCLPGFQLFDGIAMVGLISLMDHTPGQRQFTSLEAYRQYYQGKGMSDEEFERTHRGARERAQLWSDENRVALAKHAHARGWVVASHDDATLTHVEEAVRDGVTLAEFPTTLEAAEASKAAGMKVLMGGPNLVRGGSHSGNVSAVDLADRGALDVLSSDYVPFSLLQAAFALSEREGWSLPRAIATVTGAPADAVGLQDRGRLEPGRRADLVRVRWDAPGEIPVVRGVWREGQRVA